MHKKCKLEKRNRKIAYGERYNKGNWCRLCDCHFAPIINKKSERQRSKQEIRKQLRQCA